MHLQVIAKNTNKHKPLLLSLLKEEEKFELAPDRNKFERHKHKNLVSELKARRTQKGESNLVIIKGFIVTKTIANSQQPMDRTKVTPQQPMESDKIASHYPMGSALSGYCMFRRKVT